MKHFTYVLCGPEPNGNTWMVRGVVEAEIFEDALAMAVREAYQKYPHITHIAMQENEEGVDPSL